MALEAFRFGDEPAFLEAGRQEVPGRPPPPDLQPGRGDCRGDRGAPDFLAGQGRSGSSHRGRDALRHLLSLAAGIESMIVGEDQIIGQLKKALADGEADRDCGQFSRALHQQGRPRGNRGAQAHQINRGAVSVGSAAVLLAETELGTLKGRHILVIGSGEMGLLVPQALAAKRLTAMYVANRTFGRAVKLAEKIGGKAVRFNEMYHYITLSDVVISCTSAPHPVIHKADLKEAMNARCWPVEGHPRPLILIDIVQPRDVEEGSGAIDGVRLFTIDDLREVNEQTMSTPQGGGGAGQGIVNEELDLFIRRLHRKSADDCIAALHSWAEAVRMRERDGHSEGWAALMTRPEK